jgi:hypothetical protein
VIEDDFYPPGSLADRAMRALRRPETLAGRPSWKGLQVVLRIFRYVGTERDDPMGSQSGPLGTYTAWVVGRRGGGYVVRRLFWDPTPERNVADPALSLAHSDLDAADFGRRLDELHALRLPAFVPEPRGVLHGTTRGLEYGSFHSGSSFHWFHAAPAEWSALGDWWTGAVEAIESGLMASGHPRAPETVPGV